MSQQIAGKRYHGFIDFSDSKGRKWKTGRIHVWIKATPDSERSAHIGFEWLHLSKTLKRLGLKVSTTGEELLDFHYGLGPLAQHWWKFDLDGKRIPLKVRFEFEIGATGMSWCFGPNDHSWERNASLKERLRRNNLKWWKVDRYSPSESEKVESEVGATVYMPEGEYPVTVKLVRRQIVWRVGPYKWHRRSKKRLVFDLPGKRFEWFGDLEAPNGIPFPGKGENSWDCGQDGLYGLYQRVKNRGAWVEEMTTSATQSVLSSRRRYGAGFADTGA